MSPFRVASVADIEVAALVASAGSAVVFPVPVISKVATLLPEVELCTVIVALCTPAVDGENVTSNVTVPMEPVTVEDE